MATSTMFVRNHQPGPTVMDEEGFPFLRWEGFGDPLGADVLPIPGELAENHNFQRARMLGIFEVLEADEDVQALLDKAKESWDRQQARKAGINLANLGQLAAVIRSRFLVDAIAYNQVRGLPFTAAELETVFEEVVKNA